MHVLSTQSSSSCLSLSGFGVMWCCLRLSRKTAVFLATVSAIITNNSDALLTVVDARYAQVNLLTAVRQKKTRTLPTFVKSILYRDPLYINTRSVTCRDLLLIRYIYLSIYIYFSSIICMYILVAVTGGGVWLQDSSDCWEGGAGRVGRG